MATSIGVIINVGGIVAPNYATILAQLQSFYQSIYGSDVVLDSSTQDGQFLAVIASAINDCNQGAIAAYNAFSPAFAQGSGLDSVIKINGLKRNQGTASTVSVLITGIANTIITNGVVGDNLGLNTRWDLPSTVTIPGGGSITVAATCETVGAVTSGAGTLTRILTPTNGWQSVTNAAPATPGINTETDAGLRQRQSISTSLPSLAIVESLYAAIAQVTGVGRIAIYVNDTNATDSNGIPAHSFAAVVEGGVAASVAAAIAAKKSPGSGTFGTTSIVVTDSHGINNTIKFYQLSSVTIGVQVTIKALTGYTAGVGVQIQQAVAAFISSLPIGKTVYLNQVVAAAALGGIGPGATFNVTGVIQNRTPPGGGLSATDITITFNEAAICATGNVSLVVT